MNQVNSDLNNERSKSNIDIEEMKKFLGCVLYGSKENHSYLKETSEKTILMTFGLMYYMNRI